MSFSGKNSQTLTFWSKR